MRTATRGRVRELTLDRPEKLNAMSQAQWRALLAELRAAEDDPEIRVVLLKAEGRAFSVGNDITEYAALPSVAVAQSFSLDLMVTVLAALGGSRLPIVAAANGLVYGVGLEILQYCDVVVAGESSTFRLPETGIGLWPTVFTGTESYQSGRRAAELLALTGEPIDAAEALEAGFVSRVVPDERLESEAERLADAIASRGPAATAVTKRFLNRTLLDEATPVVRAALSELSARTLWSDEGREGIASFLEKRAPSF